MIGDIGDTTKMIVVTLPAPTTVTTTATKAISTISCVKIQKIANMLTLGQIKLYMGPVNKNLKKKIKILISKYAKLDFCKKKLLVQIK